MNAPTVAEYLKYANLQLAAEAFIRDPSTGVLSGSGTALEAKLVAGNLHASRFTPTAAQQFAAEWDVLDQLINSGTGFSGTLFKHRTTGELVISFRSTEFIDDAIRDSLTTGELEIKNTGFAWGQITDMEAWFGQLKSQGKIDRPYTVTGYSLGGHLATVFNLLHQSDQIPVDRVVTFNGAGIGKINQGTLAEAVSEFNRLRNDVNAVAATFADPVMGALYTSLRTELSAGILTVQQAKDQLATYTIPAWAGNPSDPTSPASIYIVPQRKRIGDALEEIERIDAQVIAVPLLTEGGAGPDAARHPKSVAAGEITGHDLNHRMAVLLLASRSETVPLPIGVYQAYQGKQGQAVLTNQFDVVGASTPSAIANSLYHYGTDVRVFIEDQPLFRGGYVQSVVDAALDYGDINLLVNGYGVKGFGDTHSLVLIVDSLNVQNTLLQLVQPTQQAAATPLLVEVLKRASNLLKKDGAAFIGTDQGKAEGDVLEYVVNALADLVLGPVELPALKGSLEGNTWAKTDQQLIEAGITGYSGRDALANRLKDITSSTAYASLAGKLDMRLTSSIATSFARTDFGTFASLYTLSPFTFSAPNGSTLESALQGAWNSAGKQIFDAWAADRLTAGGTSEPKNFNFTDRWYNDRDEMLRRLLVINQQNEPLVWDGRDPDASQITFADDPIVFQDRTKGIEIRRTAATSNAQLVVFGSAGTDSLLGAGDEDHLYGDAGDDLLDGGAGNDHLEGNAGRDTILGGDGSDLLFGGDGDDARLDGGAGADTLEGGDGFDNYYLSTCDTAVDSIFDSDNKGRLFVDGLMIGGFTALRDDLYQSTSGLYRMAVLDNGDSTRSATLYRTSDGKTLASIVGITGSTVLDYTLPIAAPPPPPSTTFSRGSGPDVLPVWDYQDAAAGDLVPGAARGDGGGMNDWLKGGSFADMELLGGAGNDVLLDYSIPDAAADAAQVSHLQGGAASDFLIGSGGTMVLDGGADNDILHGGGESDTLYGGAGNDSLLSGAGNDVLIRQMHAMAVRYQSTKAPMHEVPHA